MDFRVNDPGSVQYGNFINYYQFNSAEDRLALMPDRDNIWKQELSSHKSYIVLDIGCNCGDFTQLLYEFLVKQLQKDVHIIGIDIDPILISRARETNKFPENISYDTANIMESTEVLIEFLKKHKRKKFDAVFCLSITMWIHLNNGDSGLKQFLDISTNLSELLIIEPQPWKCYQTAVKRLKKAGETFNQFSKLKWRSGVENMIENYLETGLHQTKIYETAATKWNRKICFYRHNLTNTIK